MRSILVCLFFLCCNFIDAQVSNYKITNYSVEDGLPSNECHRILQDKEGYIWIATDRGLVRFDGYDFKVFGLKEGLTNPSVLELFYSKVKNTLYMLSFGSEVFEMDLATEEIKVFECQEIIDNYSSKHRIAEMHMSLDDDFYADLDGFGVLKIDELCEGEFIEIVNEVTNNAYVGVIAIDSATIVTYSKNKDTKTLKPFDNVLYESNGKVVGRGRLLYKDLEFAIPKIGGVPLNSAARSFQINDSIILSSAVGYDMFIKDQKVIQSNNTFQLRDVIKLSSGEYIAIRGERGGVELYQDVDELINQRKQHLIPNLASTCVFEDRFNNIWITTLDEGFFKLSKNEFKNVLQSNAEIDVTDVLVSDGHIIYIEGREKIYSSKNDTDKAIFVSELKELADIKALDDKKFVVAGRGSFVMDENYSINYIKTLSTLKGQIYTVLANNIRIFDDRKYWLSSSRFGFHDDFEALPNFISTLDLNFSNYRVLDVEKVDKDLYLLARKDGLYYFNDSIPTKIITDRPELNIRINSIVKKNQWYILATQGYGVVFWDLKDQLFVLNSEDGLCTDNTEEIYVQNDFIYVLSKVGLSQLKGDPIKGFEIRCLDSKHGLPSNQINGLAARNDSLIIATNKGLVMFNQNIEDNETTIPLFELVSANNESILNDSKIHHSLNDIKYQFKTLDYSLYGAINYRYKLNDQQWSHTSATTVNFPDLNPGFYSFQVQSQNTDGVWGASQTFDFTIKKPWWQWLSIRILFLVLLSLLGFAIYRRRLQSIKKGFQIEKELRSLEKSALAAQMNPHFIFNCLNSIQNFVMNNEKEYAMEYLGKFAQLIRGNLNASAESSLSLYDEIAMLTNYLTLEQLRLNNSFEYEITFDDSIDPLDIELPPMLIQPFVENAVVHGLKGIRKDGIIKVDFQKEKDQLIVTVFNNVADNNQSISKTNHKSYGTKITQKRLAFINGMPEDKITVTPIDTGRGSEVKISIKYR